MTWIQLNMIKSKKWQIDLSIYITLNQNNKDCMVGRQIRIRIFKMLLLGTYKKLNIKLVLQKKKINKNKIKLKMTMMITNIIM